MHSTYTSTLLPFPFLGTFLITPISLAWLHWSVAVGLSSPLVRLHSGFGPVGTVIICGFFLSVIPSPSLFLPLRLCKVGQATTTDMECTRQKIDLKPLETKWRGRRHEICLFGMACSTRWGHFRNFFDIYKHCPLMF